jgi:antitoxin MazE
MRRIARLTVQRWGHSLAVRIPAAVARSARLTAGLPVELSVEASGVLVRVASQSRLSLEQKLALFDPALHCGEQIAAVPVGREMIRRASSSVCR